MKTQTTFSTSAEIDVLEQARLERNAEYDMKIGRTIRQVRDHFTKRNDHEYTQRYWDALGMGFAVFVLRDPVLAVYPSVLNKPTDIDEQHDRTSRRQFKAVAHAATDFSYKSFTADTVEKALELLQCLLVGNSVSQVWDYIQKREKAYLSGKKDDFEKRDVVTRVASRMVDNSMFACVSSQTFHVAEICRFLSQQYQAAIEEFHTSHQTHLAYWFKQRLAYVKTEQSEVPQPARVLTLFNFPVTYKLLEVAGESDSSLRLDPSMVYPVINANAMLGDLS